MNIRVSLVDDHCMVRQGLIVMLHKIKNVEVINEFENGEDFVNYLKNNSKPNPDIVFLDYQMPKLNGIEVCSWLKENKPFIKPILLSIHNDQFIIENAIQQGAVGYLLKTASTEEMHQAILDATTSKFHFNGQFSHQMFLDLVQNKNVKSKVKNSTKLTSREKEIALLICKQMTYKEIAIELGLSQRTIEEHKKNIFKKIGVTKVTGLVVYAVKKGWI